MADYYIDANRGSDSNSGLSKNAAWKSLEAIRTKLLATPASPGDNFLFESSSVFTPDRYLRLGASTETNLYTNGDVGNLITFDKYDFSSQYSGKPQFTLTKSPKLFDWVWDSSVNMWYWPCPQDYGSAVVTWGFYPYVTMFGTMCAVVRFQSSTFTRGEWPKSPYEVATWMVSNPGRLYMWTPNATSNPSTNPTAVYGPDAIKASSSAQSVFQFNRCGSYVAVKNMNLVNSGCLAAIYQDSSGSGDVMNFTVDSCGAYNSGNLCATNLVDSGKNSDGFSILNCYGEKLVAGMFIGVSKNIVIRGNTVKGCNYGRSDGGAFYISGTYAGYGGVVEDNIISDARYETGGCTSDGCAVYLETGTYGMTVRRNEVYDSPVAFQDNTGRNTSLWHSNYVHDCDKAMIITDQGSLATTGTHSVVKVYNNTFANIGMNKQYPTMPSYKFGAIACRKGNTPLAAYYEWDFRNNIITGSGTSNTLGYGILQETGTALTFTNNLVTGFGGGVRADEYYFTNVSTPATTITSDPMLNVDGKPVEGSPAISAGTKHGLILQDKVKSLFRVTSDTTPAIGAFEYNPFRDVVAVNI